MKIINRLKHLSVCALGLTCMMNASAMTQPPAANNVHQGSYVEGSLGTAVITTLISGSSVSESSGSSNGVGFSAAYGYQFKPGGWALEVGYMQANLNLSLESDQDMNIMINQKVNIDVPYLAARWEVAMGSKFAFVPKVGAMAVILPSEKTAVRTVNGVRYTTDSGFADGTSLLLPFVGMGVSYAVTPTISIVGQYQGFLAGIINAGLMSAGLDVHF
jgi:hypothetical protein